MQSREKTIRLHLEHKEPGKVLFFKVSFQSALSRLSWLPHAAQLQRSEALLNTRQGELASGCPLLEERRHGSLVDLLTPHAHDTCIHSHCCSLAVQVIQQLQTGALQPRQLSLRGH